MLTQMFILHRNCHWVHWTTEPPPCVTNIFWNLAKYFPYHLASPKLDSNCCHNFGAELTRSWLYSLYSLYALYTAQAVVHSGGNKNTFVKLFILLPYFVVLFLEHLFSSFQWLDINSLIPILFSTFIVSSYLMCIKLNRLQFGIIPCAQKSLPNLGHGAVQKIFFRIKFWEIFWRAALLIPSRTIIDCEILHRPQTETCPRPASITTFLRAVSRPPVSGMELRCL